jgi:hypothetical protein
MPVRPNLIERIATHRFGRAPSAVVDRLDAGSFPALALAHDLGVFAALDDLLRVLAANGYDIVPLFERTGLRRDPGSELLQATRD